MGDKTGISWTDSTWNPLRGCTRVSEGCRNCYAETIAARFSDLGQPYYGIAERGRPGSKWTGEIMLVETALDQPLRWKRPRRIFVNSMSDLFHIRVKLIWVDHIFGVMALSHQHIFQILTKRPEFMLNYVTACSPGINAPHFAREQWPLPNVWLGVSVENRAAALERIPLLQKTPAAKRFLSIEPLLEDLGQIDLTGIDWVICGGESGPGARPMHPDWARSIRDQCAAAGVPYFFKQWGDWMGYGAANGKPHENLGLPRAPKEHFTFPDGEVVFRVGKKAASDFLDGVQHHNWPDA